VQRTVARACPGVKTTLGEPGTGRIRPSRYRPGLSRGLGHHARLRRKEATIGAARNRVAK